MKKPELHQTITASGCSSSTSEGPPRACYRKAAF